MTMVGVASAMEKDGDGGASVDIGPSLLFSSCHFIDSFCLPTFIPILKETAQFEGK